MTTQPRVALLPMYLALYDEIAPDTRAVFSPFLDSVMKGLAAQGLEVRQAPICCVRAEFEQAVQQFEADDVDLLVTLHLAYSPSLESAPVLAASPLPLLLLDTTMDYDFGQGVEFERRMYNHGVHGVQDLAAVLRRMNRRYHIVAGHIDHSPVLERAGAIARGAAAAKALKQMRALRLGPPFPGMHDFVVPEDTLKEVLGIEVVQEDLNALAEAVRTVDDAAVEAECRADAEAFAVDCPPEVHARSQRVGLGLRKLLEEGGYGAFSMLFRIFNSGEPPIDTLPFLEASKAMARGIGYAGEGDVLTASLTGALARNFGRTSFVEVFCADWKGGSLYLSHMGEFSPSVAGDRPRVIENEYRLSEARNPAVVLCAVQEGPATLVNLSPGPDDTFRLITAPVEVLPDAETESMRQGVRAWLKPQLPIETFLEQYSIAGGTHHSVLMLGEHQEALDAFTATAGFEAVRIGR